MSKKIILAGGLVALAAYAYAKTKSHLKTKLSQVKLSLAGQPAVKVHGIPVLDKSAYLSITMAFNVFNPFQDLGFNVQVQNVQMYLNGKPIGSFIPNGSITALQPNAITTLQNLQYKITLASLTLNDIKKGPVSYEATVKVNGIPVTTAGTLTLSSLL